MKVQKRRRREQKTDYHKRFELLKGGVPRVVFRKTNKYVISQYVESDEAQDKIVVGITSKDLLKYGWPTTASGSLKSITAAYLTGYLTGKKIQKEKLAKPIVDFGMNRVLHTSKLYGFLKGLIDSGIEINCKEEAFPSEDRIKGEHMKNKIPFDEIKSKIDKE